MNARGWWLAVLGVVGCQAQPLALQSGDVARVVGVPKGDELVLEKDGRRGHVRLLGIHAFEAVIEDAALAGLAEAAKKDLAGRVLDQTVTVTLGAKPRDDLGRYLGYAQHQGRDVGKDALANGVAIVYTEYGFEREAEYMAVEAVARDGKRQIWADTTSRKLLSGLRREWREARTSRGSAVLVDALLDPPPPAPQAVAPSPSGKP